ncbi:MAG TPA: EAL domain-containing protein [Steroidobacteraceae bacterium]|nr:EAL domain-containing protein [Steroidobacteraceae bacterium]
MNHPTTPGTRVLLIGAPARLQSALAAASGSEPVDEISFEPVADLAAGLDALKGRAYSAAVLHCQRGDSGRLEDLRILTASAPYLPVVIVAESARDGSEARARALGARDYLIQDSLDYRMLITAIREASGRQAAENAFFMRKESAQVILNSIADAVLSTDLQGHITYLNKPAERMLKMRAESLVGRPVRDMLKLVDLQTREPFMPPIDDVIESGRAMNPARDGALVRTDGTEIAVRDSASPLRNRDGMLSGAVIVLHDMSESHAMSQRMAHLAQHDHLTDLPNRALLAERLGHCVNLAERHSRRLAVLFVDLDHFKHINDSLGHSIGDEMLKEVARRLRHCVRRSDTVSRLGGDEFVILLSELEHPHDAAATAEKMRVAVTAPYFIENHRLHVGASIGISVYPDDGPDAETLIKSADMAMYHAKENGRNNCQFFENEMNVRVVQRQRMVEALDEALARNEFVLRYQPIVDLHSAQVTGAEVLIRWNHPQLGLIGPAEFIWIAEESGLIEPIGQWVLRESCLEARAWVQPGAPFKTISVNVSAREFNSKTFLDGVRATLESSGMDPRHLEIELTETSVMRDVTATSHVLEALSAQGVRFAMDDFGTGYSSLNHLMLFPINTLKIDKCFVQDVPANAHAANIVCAIVGLSHSLNLTVVGEGVESADQLSFLQARGCDAAQGHFLCKPMTGPEFHELLLSGDTRLKQRVEDARRPRPARVAGGARMGRRK